MAREMEEVHDRCQNSIGGGRLAGTVCSARRNHATGVALNCSFVVRRVCRSVNLRGEVRGDRPKVDLGFASFAGEGPYQQSDHYYNRSLKLVGRPAATATAESRAKDSPQAPGRGRIYPVSADSALGLSQRHQTKVRDQADSCSLASFVARCVKRRYGAVTPEVGIGGANRGEIIESDAPKR